MWDTIIFKSADDRMGMSTLIGGEPVSGSEMRIGNYEIEVDNEVNEQE